MIKLFVICFFIAVCLLFCLCGVFLACECLVFFLLTPIKNPAQEPESVMLLGSLPRDSSVRINAILTSAFYWTVDLYKFVSMLLLDNIFSYLSICSSAVCIEMHCLLWWFWISYCYPNRAVSTRETVVADCKSKVLDGWSFTGRGLWGPCLLMENWVACFQYT